MINRVVCTITDKGDIPASEWKNGSIQYNQDMSWQSIFDLMIESPKCVRVIKNILDLHSDRCFFIPVHKRETSYNLYTKLIELGISGVFWTSEGLSIDGDYVKVENELLHLKELMKSKPPRFLMSTRFEGIDLAGLNGIIPLAGTNYRLVVQTTGRSARMEDVLVALIYDLGNPIALSQAKKRRDQILVNYNVILDKQVKF